jgi:hypothetical protein
MRSRKRYKMHKGHSRHVFKRHALHHHRNTSGSNFAMRGGIRL